MISKNSHIVIIIGFVGLGIIGLISLGQSLFQNSEGEKINSAIFQINYLSMHPKDLIEARVFANKANNWIYYGNIENIEFWDVGKVEFDGESIFIDEPSINAIAIQYRPLKDIEILNITGDGKFSNNFDIDGDDINDFVISKEVEWDLSTPEIKKEYRTAKISGSVEWNYKKTPIDEMKITIEKIIEIEKNNPDLLSDEEADILLSYVIGKGYGLVDDEVDKKATKILVKILNNYTLVK